MGPVNLLLLGEHELYSQGPSQMDNPLPAAQVPFFFNVFYRFGYAKVMK